jgi:hypothetical protein
MSCAPLLFSFNTNTFVPLIKQSKMKDIQPGLFVKMVLDAWYLQVKRTDELLENIPGENLLQEVAPGRNSGTYLLGHLAAVHDKMLTILGFGEMLQPAMYEQFVVQPDDHNAEVASISDLKSYWVKANATLAEHFNNLTPAEWFEKHNSVSAEDFEKEPHRNKLNLIINRTNHLEYHRGQLAFLKK